MRSSYKALGKYIKPVDERNSSLEELPLMGLSVSKQFFPTIANLVGTDMKTYKVVYRNQFTYIADTSRRGDKIAIALNGIFDKMLVSQAYTPFEVKDQNELDPEYLMMWFRRPEFDRYARFKSHGSAREIFDWEEMCNVTLPIPHITKQREIVKEYNTIQNRIALNQKLIQKLEETAQAIYKQWFVDGVDLNNLPEGWEMGHLEDFVGFRNGKSKPSNAGIYPVYGGNGIIEFVSEYNSKNVIPIGRVGAYCGSLYRELGKCWISDNAISAKSKINCNMFTYYLLKDLKLNGRSEGTGQPLITQGLLNNITIAKPGIKLINDFEEKAVKLFEHEALIVKETQKLIELTELLLSKLTTVEVDK